MDVSIPEQFGGGNMGCLGGMLAVRPGLLRPSGTGARGLGKGLSGPTPSAWCPAQRGCTRLKRRPSSSGSEMMPLFDGGIEVRGGPKIVADWACSGWDGGDIGHPWRITAWKQEKSCMKDAVTGRWRAQRSGLTTHCMRQMSAVREQR